MSSSIRMEAATASIAKRSICPDLGRLSIKRGSHVEPDRTAGGSPTWARLMVPAWVRSKTAARPCEAEMDWLTTNWLPRQASS